MDDLSDLKSKAVRGLTEIREAILALIGSHSEGLRNSDVARELGLQTHVNGGQRNHLTHAILADLTRDGVIRREKRGFQVYYVVEE